LGFLAKIFKKAGIIEAPGSHWMKTGKEIGPRGPTQRVAAKVVFKYYSTSSQLINIGRFCLAVVAAELPSDIVGYKKQYILLFTLICHFTLLFQSSI
jgi:hypothetical protein